MEVLFKYKIINFKKLYLKIRINQKWRINSKISKKLFQVILR